jgi:hypothetical protein
MTEEILAEGWGRRIRRLEDILAVLEVWDGTAMDWHAVAYCHVENENLWRTWMRPVEGMARS